MLAFGRVGDIWGHGRVYRAGLLWSIAAFLLCAAAPSFNWLLFFRFLQGIGAGLIISCAPALVTGLYPEARRSRALGIFTLMFAIGSAFRPPDRRVSGVAVRLAERLLVSRADRPRRAAVLARLADERRRRRKRAVRHRRRAVARGRADIAAAWH
jgi:MFS family permease